MALKDWKKTDDGSGDRWENEKANKSIILAESYTYGSSEPKYMILMNSLTGGSRYRFKGELNGYNVKSHSQGIREIERYMRTY